LVTSLRAAGGRCQMARRRPLSSASRSRRGAPASIAWWPRRRRRRPCCRCRGWARPAGAAVHRRVRPVSQ